MHSNSGTGRREDVLEFVENKLHDLTLKDHVDCHVGGLHLWAQQCGSKHNRKALNRHPIGLPVLGHPAGGGGREGVVRRAVTQRATWRGRSLTCAGV